MSALRTLVFLTLTGVSSSRASDCSYLSLLNHLNLTSTSDVLGIMRPVKNWTSLTLVQLDMLLCGILNVDEKSQTVTSHIWTEMRWKNEFLTWNPSEFCGINMLTIPRSRLWIPDVNIQEDVSDSGSVRNSPLLSLGPSGLVFAYGCQRLTFTCQLNLLLFPFDVQLCNITFSSLGYGDLRSIHNETTLTLISEKVMFTQGEWQLENIEIIDYALDKDSTLRGTLIYRVRITRKPMLYVINFIVPLFYFLVLDLASFFISDAKGEKLNFKVTVLLSISVLLLILQDMLPSTEDQLPMIATYCILVFTLVGISVLEAMLVSFLMERDGYCGEEAQRSEAQTHEDIQLEANLHKEPAAAEGDGQVSPVTRRLPADWPRDHDLLRLILQEVKAARQEAAGPEKEEGKCGRYGRLAEIIDSAFFFLYLLTVVIFVVCMYVVWFESAGDSP